MLYILIFLFSPLTFGNVALIDTMKRVIVRTVVRLSESLSTVGSEDNQEITTIKVTGA